MPLDLAEFVLIMAAIKKLECPQMVGRKRVEVGGIFPIVRLFGTWDAVLDAIETSSGRPRPTHQEQRKWARARQIPRMYELSLRRYCGERKQLCEAADFISNNQQKASR